MKINLAQKDDGMTTGSPVETQESKPYYPCVYIRGTDKSGLKVGQKVTIYGEVIAHTEREKEDGISYDCEVECHELESGTTENKEEKKSQSKSYDEDRDAVEKGLNESSKRVNKKEKSKEEKY